MVILSLWSRIEYGSSGRRDFRGVLVPEEGMMGVWGGAIGWRVGDCFSVRASAMPRGGVIGGEMDIHVEEKKKKKGIGRKDGGICDWDWIEDEETRTGRGISRYDTVARQKK